MLASRVTGNRTVNVVLARLQDERPAVVTDRQFFIATVHKNDYITSQTRRHTIPFGKSNGAEQPKSLRAIT